jgi:hypothetical protein
MKNHKVKLGWKADTKTAFLKTDSKMESPDKLTVKTKETPALKEKK